MIAISLAPNLELSDTLLALKLMFQPWRWRKGMANGRLVAKLREVLGKEEIYTINSARWGLSVLLQNLHLEDNTEVLLQAFTCVSVPGPVVWNNLKPIYVDILEKELTMDPADLEKKISSRSRVVIIQHTFGMPARMDEIMAIAQKHNLVVIEDCAHTIGGKYHERLLGTIGDASIYSFGRDKAISSVFGGAILINNSKIFSNIKNTLEELPTNGRGWIIQQLLHPILFQFVIKPLYFVAQIGKIKLVISQKLGLISKAIARSEKSGKRPSFVCAKLSNALAELAFHQLSRVDIFNSRRREIVEMYKAGFGNMRGLPNLDANSIPYLLRYPVLVNKPKQILLNARAQHMLLGDWYEVIAPKDTNLEAVLYVNGSCRVAEAVAKRIINLPIYYKLKNREVWHIVEFIKNNV
jgi:dTDP-4-amino-4,6-dideoxygalactose transaminase